MYGRGKKQSKLKTQNKVNNIRNSFMLTQVIIDRIIKDIIITDICTLFEIQEEEKERKKLEKKKEINDRLIKNRIIRDIKTLFEQEDDDGYFKPKRVSNFWNNNYIEYKSNGDRSKTYH